jgi:hypothetical protein
VNGKRHTIQYRMSKKNLSQEEVQQLMKQEEEAFGRELQVGIIARLKSSKIDFDQALQAGPDEAEKYFSEMLMGIRLGHITQLREAKFFEMVEDQLGISIDVGCWEEIIADELPIFLKIIEKVRKKVDERLATLLESIERISQEAYADNCSVVFMLADDELMDFDDLALEDDFSDGLGDDENWDDEEEGAGEWDDFDERR